MAEGFRLTGVDDLVKRLEGVPVTLREVVGREVETIVRDGVRFWRARTPYRTGRLRNAERARILRTRGDFAVGAEFILRGPRARVYFILAARHYPHLRRVMHDWVTRVGNPRVLDATRRALRQAGFTG